MFPNQPKMLSPIVYPTKCCDVHDTEVFEVPHIHPTHTTVHHHNLFNHIHTCPQTVSHVSDAAHQHVNCCQGPMPMPMPMPMAGMTQGMAPGMTPGMSPDMVSPAMESGMPTGVAPEMGSCMMPDPRINPYF